MKVHTDVLIVGGGIAGLTTALTLHASGISSIIVETVPLYKPIGAGINLLPHAVEVLAEIGLLDPVRACSNETREMRFLHSSGYELFKTPRGLAAGLPTPQISIHRGALHDVLATAHQERIGADYLMMDSRIVHLEQDGDRVAATISKGCSTQIQVEAAIAIGCDGLRSQVRHKFYPDEGDPLYSGVLLWRGITKTSKFLDGHTMVLAGSLKDGKLVAYPISEVDSDGMQAVNWLIERKESDGGIAEWDCDTHRDLSWVNFDWSLDWLNVRKLIAGAETILVYPMVDRDPLPRWSFGRITLAGDAAHPMYPFGSNGAGQAILDASVLADALSTFGLNANALTQYEHCRLPATAAVSLLNRKTPPDAILDIADEQIVNPEHLPSDDGCRAALASRMSDVMQQYQAVTANRVKFTPSMAIG